MKEFKEKKINEINVFFVNNWKENKENYVRNMIVKKEKEKNVKIVKKEKEKKKKKEKELKMNENNVN